MAYQSNIDYSTQIKNAINAGATSNDVQSLLSSRVEKANSSANTTKYAYDDIYKQANDYIGKNKPQAPQAVDNSAKISQMYDESTTQLINKIKQKIATAKATQQKTIDTAPQTYQPLKNESEINRVRALDGIREQSANMGDRGGIGRSELLTADTSYGNNLNNINLQQQQMINDANAQIAQLESNGDFETANIVAQQAQAKLQALIGESNRVESTAYNRMQDANSLQTKTSNDALSREVDTISRFANNYMAEINRRKSTPDTADDALIPYLETARQDKINTQAQSQIDTEQMTYDRWLEQQKLGIDQQKADYTTNKPYYKSSGDSSGSSGNIDNSTKTIDSAYEINAYNTLKSDLQQGGAWDSEGLNYITNNYDSLVAKYGKNAVNAIASDINSIKSTSTKPKEKSATDESNQAISDVMASYQRDGFDNYAALADLKKYQAQYIAEIGKTAYDYLVKQYSQ